MKKLAIVLVALSFLAVTANLVEAGRAPSPGVDVARCEAYSSVTYYERFYGGEGWPASRSSATATPTWTCSSTTCRAG